jgi:hypothetical protein
MAVKAAVEDCSARARSGQGERGRRGGGGVVRRGGTRAPFYWVGGERGGPTGRGIGWPVVGHHYGPSRSVGRGNKGGGRGVKRGRGVRHRFRERRGHQGGVRALEAAAVVAFGRLRPRDEGSRWGPCSCERRGWRWAGPAGDQGIVGRETGGLAWEKKAAQERRRGEWADRRPRPRRLG